MTSEKKVASNRANAKFSTGAKTENGKAKSSHNAFRHGLAVSPASDPALSAAAKRLQRQLIIGDNTESAGVVAEAVAELLRVRAVRTQIISEVGDLKDAGTISKTMRELLKTDRYERRALSRLNTALREPKSTCT